MLSDGVQVRVVLAQPTQGSRLSATHFDCFRFIRRLEGHIGLRRRGKVH